MDLILKRNAAVEVTRQNIEHVRAKKRIHGIKSISYKATH